MTEIFASPSLDALTTQERRDLFEALTYTSAAEAYEGIGKVFAATGGYDDSIDREAMFAAASANLGVPYEDIYDLWLGGDPLWGDA